MLRRGMLGRNLVAASSAFRFSAGARLCRIIPPRNSSGCCRSADIRHDPGFGIALQIVRRQVGHSNASGGFGFPIVADKVDSSMDIDLDTF
jgi:hypothetical protein